MVGVMNGSKQERRTNMAPDKIYLNTPKIQPELDNTTCDTKTYANCENVEYIRKEALLEWAKNLKDRWEEPPMSRHSPGCVFMLEQVINKLNSM